MFKQEKLFLWSSLNFTAKFAFFKSSFSIQMNSFFLKHLHRVFWTNETFVRAFGEELRILFYFFNKKKLERSYVFNYKSDLINLKYANKRTCGGEVIAPPRVSKFGKNQKFYGSDKKSLGQNLR